MGKSKATPRPSVSEVTVMMITAATNCQREIWIRLAMYCWKGRLEDAARVLCPRGADSLRGTDMVQTIAEAGCTGDCQHGHGSGLRARWISTREPSPAVERQPGCGLRVCVRTPHCVVPPGLDLRQSYPALPCRATDCPVPSGLIASGDLRFFFSLCWSI